MWTEFLGTEMLSLHLDRVKTLHARAVADWGWLCLAAMVEATVAEAAEEDA